MFRLIGSLVSVYCPGGAFPKSRHRHLIATCLLTGFLTAASVWAGPSQVNDFPKLAIFKEQRTYGSRTFVTVRSPAIEGIGTEIWCYENEFGNPTYTESSERRIFLRHEAQGNQLETTFESQPGSVVMTASLTGDNIESLRLGLLINLCITYQRSRAFGNKKDKFDESYLDDFVGRSFLFLDRGLVHLKDTNRRPSVDSRDNPYSERARAPRPWVQDYVPEWGNFAKFVDTFFGKRPLSPDRPVLPIMGVVSHDGNFLSAFAFPDTERMGQVFISCLHPNPILQPDSEQPGEKRWSTTGKIYLMENDPQRLLERFKQDFPDWHEPSTDDPITSGF